MFWSRLQAAARLHHRQLVKPGHVVRAPSALPLEREVPTESQPRHLPQSRPLRWGSVYAGDQIEAGDQKRRM